MKADHSKDMHEFVEVRCAWLNGRKLKQNAPIDEAEAQDNVTR